MPSTSSRYTPATEDEEVDPLLAAMGIRPGSADSSSGVQADLAAVRTGVQRDLRSAMTPSAAMGFNQPASSPSPDDIMAAMGYGPQAASAPAAVAESTKERARRILAGGPAPMPRVSATDAMTRSPADMIRTAMGVGQTQPGMQSPQDLIQAAMGYGQRRIPSSGDPLVRAAMGGSQAQPSAVSIADAMGISALRGNLQSARQAMLDGVRIPDLNTPPEKAENDLNYLDLMTLRGAGSPLASRFDQPLIAGGSTVDQRRAAVQAMADAGQSAMAAKTKSQSEQGNFKTLDDAVAKAKALREQGEEGVHVISKKGGTYEIEIRPSSTIDPSQRIEAALDLAREDLAAAQKTGDKDAVAKAEERIADYSDRKKKIDGQSRGGLAGMLSPNLDEDSPAGAAPAAGDQAALPKFGAEYEGKIVTGPGGRYYVHDGVPRPIR
jgi:hypothetical protein